MMLTEKNLRKFKKVLNEEIHLPHNTKNAKVVTHVDLDGLVSGISMVKQLEKQGIPNNRIVIDMAQYGDEKKSKNFTGKFENKKNQFVGVTDFAKLPKAKPFDSFNKLLDFQAGKHKKEIVDFINSKDFTKVSFSDFEKELKNRFNFKEGKFTKSNIRELYLAFKGYSRNKNVKATIDNIEELDYPTVVPDMVDDHHTNENNALSGGKRGEIAADSPSEAERFADKYSPGLWSKEDLDAVSMIDSANYDVDQLENTVFLNKNFSGSDKKKNLAIIISCLYDNLAKKDREAAKWVIRTANPNLVSVYTTTLKALKYNKDRIEYLTALKSGDIETAKEILKKIPNILTKQYDRHTDQMIKPALNYEDWKNKNKKDLTNAKTGYKTEADEQKLLDIKGKRGDEYKEIRDKIKSKKGKIATWGKMPNGFNLFTMFNGGDKKTQYSRFMTSLYSKNGKRSPFTLRYWSNSMFQLAKNTLYKGDVDFKKVQDHVLEDIKKFLSSKGLSELKIKNIINNMEEGNGGHASGIWTFGSFDKIKPPSSKEVDEYWNKKNMIDRATKIGKDPNELIPNSVKRKEEIENNTINKYKEIQKECFKKAIGSAMKWTGKLYPPKEEDMQGLITKNNKFEEN